MDMKEIEQYFEGYKLRGEYPVVPIMGWLIQRVRELESNIPDPEWCCAEHKQVLADRVKELESQDIRLGKLFKEVQKINPYLETKVKSLEAELDREMTYKEAIEEAVSRVKELESDLRLNSAMLSQQFDLAREAECKMMEAESELHNIDELLSRRDALDNEPTRYDKIIKAIQTAKQTDRTADRVKSLEAELSRMKLEKIPLVEEEK